MNRTWSLLQHVTRGRIRVRQPGAERRLYLTFDDGPHPKFTLQLLRLLELHGAKGTFFMVGASAVRYRNVVESVVAAGHTIGNHSYTHPRFLKLGRSARRTEIQATDNVLQDADSKSVHLFRPPRGEMSLSMLWEYVSDGPTCVMWTYDSLDYRLHSAEVARRCASLPLVGGEIILFHDDGACATEALSELLPLWASQGFEFASLPD